MTSKIATTGAASDNRAVLLIDCPRPEGLVARVPGALRTGAKYSAATNIRTMRSALLYAREWAIESASMRTCIAAFTKAFTPLPTSWQMRWQLRPMYQRPRVALFLLAVLHCIADLLQRSILAELDCEIAVIVSNHRRWRGWQLLGIRLEHIPVTPPTREQAEAQQWRCWPSWRRTCGAGSLHAILTENFVAHYPAAIIHVHHSFLPALLGAALPCGSCARLS